MFGDSGARRMNEDIQRLKTLCFQRGFVAELGRVWPSYVKIPPDYSKEVGKGCSLRPAIPYERTLAHLHEIFQNIEILALWPDRGRESVEAGFDAFEAEIYTWEIERDAAMNAAQPLNLHTERFFDFVLALLDLDHASKDRTLKEIINDILAAAEPLICEGGIGRGSDSTIYGDIENWPRKIRLKLRTDKKFREKFYLLAEMSHDNPDRIRE